MSDFSGQSSPEQPEQSGKFPIIGLGASAGGLQALKRFFENMPDENGMAFVVIMHLSPKRESHAAEILQAATAMPVMQVNEPVRVEPDKVYVIPPTKQLLMSDGFIRLSEPAPTKGRNVAIDIYFRTLADAHRQHAVCVVLSGTGSDGTSGLKRIKERGGISFAQAPQDAEYDSMPRNAINTGMVDFVLPAAEMPEKLISLWRNASQIKLPPVEDEAPAASVAGHDKEAEDALRDILNILRARTDHDFTHYKRATVLRRIERRLQVNQLQDIIAYRDFLKEHDEEAQRLLKDLLISVTNFFRDREAFQAFEREVVPLLFHEKTRGDVVRVWVAGCATGEEAYSVAILLMEYAAHLAESPGIQIFATDIDENAVAFGREGFYTESIEVDVSPERLHRFFSKEIGGYRVKKDVREKVLFATHNLIKDPPFSKLDLITCRNLLIYLKRDMQEQLFESFQFTLRVGGFLFLGGSESANAAPEQFTPVDKKQRLYRSSAVGRASLRVPQLPLQGASFKRRVSRASDDAAERKRISFGELHQQLLEQYAPPSVIVNGEYEIVHLSDRAGRFLQFAGGDPSHNLLKIVRPELRIELRTALFQAAQTGKSIEARRVSIKRDERRTFVNMIVRPMRETEGVIAFSYFLVIFEEVEDTMSAEGDERIKESEPVVNRLEEELRRTKEQLQTGVEQYETQTEELKASNEELQSINEELRSTTEELETSKEELQSVNEELTTVNYELKNNLEEIGATNDDLQNLIASTEIATVFLDSHLHIKLYTPRALDIFNLIPSDIGRPLADITHNLIDDELLRDARRTLTTPKMVEREIASRDHRFYFARVTPYRTAANSGGGVILTFVDFTKRKQAEESLLEAKERLRLLVESAKDHSVYMMDANGRIDYWNAGAQTLFGYTESDIIGQSAALLYTAEDRESHELERELREAHECGSTEAERWHVRKDGTRFYASGVLTLLRDERVETGTSHGYAMIARDLTERKVAEEAIRFQAHLLDTVEQSVIATNLDGIVIYWNHFARQLYGWTAQEAIGRHIMELTTPEVMTEQALEIMSHLSQGESWTGEFNVQRRDGTTFPAQIINSPINDDKGTLVGIVGVSIDNTERKQAEENLRISQTELQKSHDELERRVAQRTAALSETNDILQEEIRERRRIEAERVELLRRVIFAQEDERRRIAREMHDQFGQGLSALTLKLAALKGESGEHEKLFEQLEILEAVANQLDSDVDFLVWELRPTVLDDLGLAAALKAYVQNWSKHFDTHAELHVSGMKQKRLTEENETVLYRITQEALNNIAKHARAGKVDILLEQRDQHVSLIIEDDGVGFDGAQAFGPNDKGLGLMGMRERAALVGGTVEIESHPNDGTTVFIRIPVPQEGGQGE